MCFSINCKTVNSIIIRGKRSSHDDDYCPSLCRQRQCLCALNRMYVCSVTWVSTIPKKRPKKPFIHIMHAILSSSCSPLHSINQQFPRTAIYRFEIHSYLVFSFAITALCIGFLAGLKNLTPSHTLNMFKIFCCHKI